MQKEGYQTKVMKPQSTKTKEETLPIYKKRNHWCFRHNGVLHKLDSESEAKEMYKALN